MRRRLPNSAGCYVCGDANPRGLGVKFEVEGGVVTARFIPHRDHCGYNDRVHGGIIAALLDEVMGWAPSVIKRRFCVAAEIATHYTPHALRHTYATRLVSAGVDLRYVSEQLGARQIWVITKDQPTAARTLTWGRLKARYK